MKSIKIAPSLLFIVAILMTSCATVPERDTKGRWDHHQTWLSLAERRSDVKEGEP